MRAPCDHSDHIGLHQRSVLGHKYVPLFVEAWGHLEFQNAVRVREQHRCNMHSMSLFCSCTSTLFSFPTAALLGLL